MMHACIHSYSDQAIEAISGGTPIHRLNPYPVTACPLGIRDLRKAWPHTIIAPFLEVFDRCTSISSEMIPCLRLCFDLAL